MLVFDASKSMAAAAGDNTGLRRIDSVRTALARILPRVSPKRRLGSSPTGPARVRPASTSAWSCRPAPNAARADHVACRPALKPDGKTPLTRAVRMAADALDYRDRPGTIVLLTDGEETCGASPCALAKTLKADGAHTTVHVISYRIASAIGSDGVFASRCLADETGGLYVAADTIDEVTAALETALACPVVSEAVDRR